MSAIRDGLSQAPNAVYALVQTVLLQDEDAGIGSHRMPYTEHVDGTARQRARHIGR